MKAISIHEIASKGSVKDLVDALIQRPNLIDIKDEKGMTPLHRAAATHDDKADMVLALLNYGADPNAKDNDGWTPLDWADFYINRDVLLLLTSITERDKEG